MRSWVWARSVAVVGLTSLLLNFFGCTFTVDTGPLSNRQCPGGKKACKVDGKDACVDPDDPNFGCSPTTCDSCGTLGFRNGTANCNRIQQRCAVAACNAGYRHCQSVNPDETKGCETSVASDNGNCGACGNVCGARDHATNNCINSTCTTTCDMGYIDCDKLASNGCECGPNKTCTNGTCMP
jgi:hypothetical protein